jgi:antitoxin ParD1/3/4
MSVTLSPELEEAIRRKVAEGLYGSTDEVIQEALRLLEDRDHLRALKLDALRAEIAVGIEQADRGQVAPLDMDTIRARAAERIRTARDQS